MILKPRAQRTATSLFLLEFAMSTNGQLATDRDCGPLSQKAMMKKLGENYKANYMAFQEPPKEPARRRRQTTDTKAVLPFECAFTANWTRAESETYPPFLKSGYCTKKTCFHEQYECTPVTNDVQVLHWPQGNCHDQISDPSSWTWMTKRLNVDCKCGAPK